MNVYAGFWIMALIFAFVAATFAVNAERSRSHKGTTQMYAVSITALAVAVGSSIAATWLMVAGI